jgi:hypothetical protein
VRNDVRVIDAEFGQCAVQVSCVTIDAVVEVPGPVGLALSRDVHRDAAGKISGAFEQVGPVSGWSRVAVHEDPERPYGTSGWLCTARWNMGVAFLE